ncbi:MAG: AAA family ATPase [Myxococcales bacterium]
MTTSPAPENFVTSARAFRAFFEEIGSHFLERERLLEQLQLALLSREHLLTFGPPGTAKSQLALSVMKRIVDAQSGAPSVFSKQIAETTVQSDLVGPVDFKVLTRTGRTEHLTDEGILGAVHGILDEVFDGREMLLRSILNLLEEREHKSGHKITAGRTECTVMTSNRYLSEVVQRNPELMLAFSDRISFVCFVPKGFARPASRAEMLRRAALHERPVFRCPLTIQDLDVLQAAADAVVLPQEVLEALERLADSLERRLSDEANRQASYRPTKYFSNRTLVKSIKALKAGVALDAVRQKRGWPLTATLGDLSSLTAFFTLAGPSGDDLAVHLRTATDLRERAQLETVQLELKVFGEALAAALTGLMGGAEREASSLGLPRLVGEAGKSVERLRSCGPDGIVSFSKEAAEAAVKVGALLRPPPRFHANALPLHATLDQIVDAFTDRLSALEVPEEALPEFLASALKVVGARGYLGQHSAKTSQLVEQGMAAAALAFSGLASEQQAARFQPAAFESIEKVEQRARSLAARLSALEQAVADLATAPDAQAKGFREAAQANHEARRTCALSLLQSLNVAGGKLLAERGGGGQPSLDLPELSAQLAKAEEALRVLDPNVPGAREIVAATAWKRLLDELPGRRAGRHRPRPHPRRGRPPPAAVAGGRQGARGRAAGDGRRALPAPGPDLVGDQAPGGAREAAAPLPEDVPQAARRAGRHPRAARPAGPGRRGARRSLGAGARRSRRGRPRVAQGVDGGARRLAGAAQAEDRRGCGSPLAAQRRLRQQAAGTALRRPRAAAGQGSPDIARAGRRGRRGGGEEGSRGDAR